MSTNIGKINYPQINKVILICRIITIIHDSIVCIIIFVAIIIIPAP